MAYGDSPAGLLHHRFADCEPQSCPAGASRARGISPVKAVEEMRQHLHGDGFAGISHDNGYHIALYRRLHRDHLALWAVLNRILQELGADRLPAVPGDGRANGLVAGTLESHSSE